MNDAGENGIERAADMRVAQASQKAKPDERATRLQSLRLDIIQYQDAIESIGRKIEQPSADFQGLDLSLEAQDALEAKRQEEVLLKEQQKKTYEMKWKALLLFDEPLSFDEVKQFTQLERPRTFPSHGELLAHVRNKPKETIQNAEAHRVEIENQGGNVEVMVKNYERFEDFKDFEIKRIEDLRHWDKIKSFLEVSNINVDGMKVIVIDNKDYWKNFYGSNPSKSVVEPKTIILKKEIFEAEDISEEDISWIVHEVGHLSFYDFLDDKKGEYMAGVEKHQKYTETAMESIAFQIQVDYLKSLGKMREDCLVFMQSYADESFGSDENLGSAQKEVKQKELGQLTRYVHNVFIL